MDNYISELVKRIYKQIECPKDDLCPYCLVLKEATSTIQMLKTQEEIRGK